MLCHLEYVGETQRAVAIRLKEHHNPHQVPRPTTTNNLNENHDDFGPSAVALHCIAEHNSEFNLATSLVGKTRSYAH